MSKPFISFIIPAHNEEKYIERTLVSLKNQETSIPYEIIICDNNSADKTVQIAKKYADKIVCEKKQGSVFARNTGFKHTSGKYLVHTDADTVFPKDFVERAYKIFCMNKYVGFTCGKWDYNEGKSFLSKFFAKVIGKIMSFGFRVQKRWGTLILPGWCICTPRWVFEKVGGFAPQTDFFDDLQYSVAIEDLGKKAYFPDINVRSSTRRHEGKKKTGLRGLRYYIKNKKSYPKLLLSLFTKVKL